jgi:outer membrane protein assembly factor BamB
MYAQPIFFGGMPRPTSLSPVVRLFEIDGDLRRQLEQLEAQVAADEGTEAMEGLRQFAESTTAQVLAIAPHVYVTLANYCHTRLAALPEETLDLYRRRVDADAKLLLEQGLSEHDDRPLLEIVRRFYCSSLGDDALWALGEFALERGEYNRAEGYWRQLFPELPNVRGDHLQKLLADGTLSEPDRKLIRKWYVSPNQPKETARLIADVPLPDLDRVALVRIWKERGLVSNYLCYPNTDISLAQIRAGLILVDIRCGNTARAQQDLKILKDQYPNAKGRFAGSEVELTTWLSTQLKLAASDTPTKTSNEWSTLGGNAARDGKGARSLQIANFAFPPIAVEPTPFDPKNYDVSGKFRVGDEPQKPLAVHPVVWKDTLLYGAGNHLYAVSLLTGKPAWPSTVGSLGPNGQIFEGPPNMGRTAPVVGVARYTLTVYDSKLYACVGSQVTNSAGDQQTGGNMLICLDLSAQGKLLWTLKSEDTGWRFEGPPLVDGERIYVGVRKGGARPTAAVECYDQAPRVGNQMGMPRQRWRTSICSAESPALGVFDEVTHNLVTLYEGNIYYNTNLGAIASLDAVDGRPNWIYQYDRAVRIGSSASPNREFASHFQRDLNPCLAHGGLIYVAPADSAQVFALDAQTGRVSWATISYSQDVDVLHLLGVVGDRLIACGSHLYWFDAQPKRGKLLATYPEGKEKLGYGRGVLAGDHVYWCEQNALFVFQQQLDEERDSENRTHFKPRLAQEPFSLVHDALSARGGNLMPTEKQLIVASTDKIYVFHEDGHAGDPEKKSKAAAKTK